VQAGPLHAGPQRKDWGTKPKLTQITFKELTDANLALAAYKAGELDVKSGVPGGTRANHDE